MNARHNPCHPALPPLVRLAVPDGPTLFPLSQPDSASALLCNSPHQTNPPTFPDQQQLHLQLQSLESHPWITWITFKHDPWYFHQGKKREFIPTLLFGKFENAPIMETHVQAAATLTTPSTDNEDTLTCSNSECHTHPQKAESSMGCVVLGKKPGRKKIGYICMNAKKIYKGNFPGLPQLSFYDQNLGGESACNVKAWLAHLRGCSCKIAWLSIFKETRCSK